MNIFCPLTESKPMSASSWFKMCTVKTMLLLICTATWAAPSQITPTARTLYPYWQMILEVTNQIDSRPPRPLGINKGLQTPAPNYPFDSFRHLRTVDLLRAAQEGMDFARLEQARGTDAAEIEQQILKNITIALEYLPLLIKDQGDIWEILNLIQNQKQDKLLRIFLLEQVYGIAQPETLLSMTLPELLFSLERRRGKGISSDVNPVAAAAIPGAETMFHETMLRLSSHPSEVPEIQAMALAQYYAFLAEQYLITMNKIPEVEEAKALGLEVDIYAVKREDFSLSQESKNLLRSQAKVLESLAAAVSGHISEDSVRDQKVQEITDYILKDMQGKYVGIDEDKLALYRDGIVPATESLAPPTAFEGLPEHIQDALIPPEGKPLSFDAL